MKESLLFRCKISKPMYDVSKVKYIDFEIPESITTKIQDLYEREAKYYKLNVPTIPLKGNVLSVKVPWRYNRVGCTVNGLVPVQDMEKDQEATVVIEYCGTWALGMFWKLGAITAC